MVQGGDRITPTVVRELLSPRKILCATVSGPPPSVSLDLPIPLFRQADPAQISCPRMSSYAVDLSPHCRDKFPSVKGEFDYTRGGLARLRSDARASNPLGVSLYTY